MGTRSLTILKDGTTETAQDIAVMYRQYDGYPSGLGQELAEYLSGFNVVNGISNETTKLANGPDCLAAQIIAHFKESVGNVYLMRADTRNCGEEYRYYIYSEAGKPITIKVGKMIWVDGQNDTEKVIFDGTPESMLVWLKTDKP